VEFQLHSFFILAICEVESLTSRPGRFFSWKEPGTHRTGGWVGPIASSGHFVVAKNIGRKVAGIPFFFFSYSSIATQIWESQIFFGATSTYVVCYHHHHHLDDNLKCGSSTFVRLTWTYRIVAILVTQLVHTPCSSHVSNRHVCALSSFRNFKTRSPKLPLIFALKLQKEINISHCRHLVTSRDLYKCHCGKF